MALAIKVRTQHQPATRSIKDDYEYEIGKDGPIQIEFEGASNGNCLFESTIEVDGPSEGIALFFPEILVQSKEFPEIYQKIKDPTLTISTSIADFAGDYKITYKMTDEANRVSESFSFNVEVIAPEEESGSADETEEGESSLGTNARH